MIDLIRLGGAAAIVGGALRAMTAFIPYVPDSVWQEAVFAVVDIGLLFGLIALYCANAEALGRAGLFIWAIALAALASIVGPDARAFDIDWYFLGAAVFLLALGALAALMIVHRVSRLAAATWLGALAAGLIVPTQFHDIAFLASGALLGLGFVFAGIELLNTARRAQRQA